MRPGTARVPGVRRTEVELVGYPETAERIIVRTWPDGTLAEDVYVRAERGGELVAGAAKLQERATSKNCSACGWPIRPGQAYLPTSNEHLACPSEAEQERMRRKAARE
jgi:predicted RNA-binding Zn-ribbon protein involved in translation (DUF1610 family)